MLRHYKIVNLIFVAQTDHMIVTGENINNTRQRRKHINTNTKNTRNINTEMH